MELQRKPGGNGEDQLLEIIRLVNRSYVGFDDVKPVRVEYVYNCLTLEYEVRIIDCHINALCILAEYGYRVKVTKNWAVVRSEEKPQIVDVPPDRLKEWMGGDR